MQLESFDNGKKEKTNTYSSKPRTGESSTWEMYNEMLLGKVVFQGVLSNEGKSRNLINLASQ